jgi:hypothetical protein
MLSFHRVGEAIASGIVGFHFIPGEHNPADILSKHWGYTQIRERLKSLLVWKGDTAAILVENPTSLAKRGMTIFWLEYRWNIGKESYQVYVMST